MMILKKLINKNNFIVLTVTLYIFFWDVAQTLRLNFDPRLIIFALSLFMLIEIVKDIKNKNYQFIYIGILILIFLVAHSYLVGNLLNIKFFLSLFFLIYLFGIAYYFYDIILNNKKQITYLFISLFLISIFIHFFMNISSNPEPFSCGAIKNLFKEKNNLSSPIFLIHFFSSYSLIFAENSHLAMSVIAVIIYSIFLITKGKNKKFVIFFVCIFIAICFLKSSATLLAGIIFSIVTLLLVEYKRLNKYFIISSLVLISIITLIFTQDKVCLNKIVLDQRQIVEIKKINPISTHKKIDKKILDMKQNLKNLDKNSLNFEEEKLKILAQLGILKKEKNTFLKNEQIKAKEFKVLYPGSLSSEVFFHALKVTYTSFISKPFGYGFQGYELAFNSYNKANKIYRKGLEEYNSKDASNTLFKSITEFGIFSVALYFLLLSIFFNTKISVENKVFLIPFIVTQSIRGAGYFNSGYLLILFLLIIIHYKKINKRIN